MESRLLSFNWRETLLLLHSTFVSIEICRKSHQLLILAIILQFLSPVSDHYIWDRILFHEILNADLLIRGATFSFIILLGRQGVLFFDRRHWAEQCFFRSLSWQGCNVVEWHSSAIIVNFSFLGLIWAQNCLSFRKKEIKLRQLRWWERRRLVVTFAGSVLLNLGVTANLVKSCLQTLLSLSYRCDLFWSILCLGRWQLVQVNRDFGHIFNPAGSFL